MTITSIIRMSWLAGLCLLPPEPGRAGGDPPSGSGPGVQHAGFVDVEFLDGPAGSGAWRAQDSTDVRWADDARGGAKLLIPLKLPAQGRAGPITRYLLVSARAPDTRGRLNDTESVAVELETSRAGDPLALVRLPVDVNLGGNHTKEDVQLVLVLRPLEKRLLLELVAGCELSLWGGLGDCIAGRKRGEKCGGCSTSRWRSARLVPDGLELGVPGQSGDPTCGEPDYDQSRRLELRDGTWYTPQLMVDSEDARAASLDLPTDACRLVFLREAPFLRIEPVGAVAVPPPSAGRVPSYSRHRHSDNKK